MGGFIDFILSINKIAIVAFCAVFGFLIYEVKKMIDDQKKKEKPVVPQFDDKIQIKPLVVANSTPLPSSASLKKSERGGNPLLLIIIGIVSLGCVVGLIVIYYNINVKKLKVASSVPIIREITSAGLKVYDSNWKEIANDTSEKAKPGEKLYIGIQTIVEADIDRARIRVNTLDWRISDITTLFNTQRKVYYKEYTIATGTAQLKIEAQLHSGSDGWLGD